MKTERFSNAALLAGGEGRRLGNLAKESIEGPEGPLGPALARRLACAFDDIRVITSRPDLYATLGLKGLKTLEDLRPGFGPLSGLHAALSRSSSEWLYLTACDMPGFSPEFAAFLRGRIEAAEAAASTSAGAARPLAALARFGSHFEPFHAFYHRSLIPRLEALFSKTPAGGGRRPSFKDLFDDLPVLYVSEDETRRFSPDWSLFFNINTPEELACFCGARNGAHAERF